MRNLLSLLKHALVQVGDAFQAAGHWWLNELLATLPSQLSDWLTENRTRILVLAADETAVTFHLTSDRRRVLASALVDKADYAPHNIDTFLHAQRQTRASVSISLRLPSRLVFARNLILPLEVRRTLDAVVTQDMISKTPFQLDDVYHAHTALRADDKIVVHQWIIRRKHVHTLADALSVDLGDITFIEPERSEDALESPPVVRLRGPASGRVRWTRRIGLALATTALLLAIGAAGLRYSHQQMLLDRLQGEVATARSQAQQTLAVLKGVERDRAGLHLIRLRRSGEPSLLDVWAEVTHVLPSGSWLTELRVSEVADSRQVVMTGLSAAAAALVPLVDRSTLFINASLIAPISLDAAEQRERFSIQAHVLSLSKSKTAAR